MCTKARDAMAIVAIPMYAPAHLNPTHCPNLSRHPTRGAILNDMPRHLFQEVSRASGRMPSSSPFLCPSPCRTPHNTVGTSRLTDRGGRDLRFFRSSSPPPTSNNRGSTDRAKLSPRLSVDPKSTSLSDLLRARGLELADACRRYLCPSTLARPCPYRHRLSEVCVATWRMDQQHRVLSTKACC